jgi:hypothetical protein
MNNIKISKSDEKDLKFIAITLNKQAKWTKENPDMALSAINNIFTPNHSRNYLAAMTRVRSKYGKAYLDIINTFMKYDEMNREQKSVGKNSEK